MSGQMHTSFSTALAEAGEVSATVTVPSSATPGKNKLSTRGLFFNVVLSIIGTTVLGIAAQMKRVGWIFGPLLLTIGCAIAAEMTRLVSSAIDLLMMRDSKQIRTFQEFAESAFGPFGGKVAMVASTLSLLGMICNGLVIESQNLQIIAPAQILIGDFVKTKESGNSFWAVILTSTTFFYAFVDIGSLLKKSAVLGPFVCGLCVLLAWIGTGSAAAELQDIPSSCLESQSESNWTLLFEGKQPVDALLDLASVACYSFYVFAVVVTVPNLKDQMEEPKKLTRAATSAYFLSSALYLSIMVIGYWGFGNLMPVSDNLIDGMRQDRPVGWWALTRPWETGSATFFGNVFAWMIIVNLLLTDAIYVPCTVVAFETAFSSFFQPGYRVRGAVLRICISLFRLLVATCVTSFVALTNLTSALFCVLINIIMPIAAFYRLRVEETSRAVRVLHTLIFIFGWMVMLVGSWKAISDILFKEQFPEKGLFPRFGITTACQEAYWEANRMTVIQM